MSVISRLAQVERRGTCSRRLVLVREGAAEDHVEVGSLVADGLQQVASAVDALDHEPVEGLRRRSSRSESMPSNWTNSATAAQLGEELTTTRAHPLVHGGASTCGPRSIGSGGESANPLVSGARRDSSATNATGPSIALAVLDPRDVTGDRLENPGAHHDLPRPGPVLSRGDLVDRRSTRWPRPSTGPGRGRSS